MKKICDFIKNLFAFLFSLFVVLEDIDGGDVHQELDYSELLTPGLRKVFYQEFESVPDVYDKIFHVNGSNKYKEEDFMMGAMSPWTEFGSSTASVAAESNMSKVPYDTVAKGNIQTYVHKEFAKGFMIEKKFLDDEQYGVLDQMSKDLAHAGRVKMETDAATFLETTAFNTATLNRAVDERLFSATHALLSSTDTYSNLMTDKLGYESLRTAIKLMKKTPDQAGNPIVLIPDKLIIPIDLEDTAREILETAKKPGSNDNDVNTIKQLEIVVNPYFSSADQWYLQSRRHKMNWFWRIRPFFDKDKDFDTLVRKWMGYMRYSLGATDWRGIIGSTGAGAAGATHFSMLKSIQDDIKRVATATEAIEDNTIVPDATNVMMIKPASFTVAAGATLQVAAVVFPADANQGINWSSSVPAKATIDANGLITGVAAGETVIKAASYNDATKYVEATLTVTAS